MRKLLSFALVCYILLGFCAPAVAEQVQVPQFNLGSEQALPFSQTPLRIDQAERLPNENLCFIYFSQGSKQGEEAYWLDLFSGTGERLLSRQFTTHIPDVSTYPHAQILIKNKGFVCEFYPDITTMEVCYQTGYDFNGKVLRKEKKSTLRLGDALYVKNLGQFILKRQAHSYDTEPVDPYLRLQIEHVPTGQMVDSKLWDPNPAYFIHGENQLLLVCKNEQENLEIRSYTVSDSLQEQVITFHEPALNTQGYTVVSSGVLFQGQAYLLIYQSNTAYALLTYDLKQQQITASKALTALPGVDYVTSLLVAGEQLMAVNGIWDESVQRYHLTLSLLDDLGEQVPLHFVGRAAAVFADGEGGTITAIERDAASGQWFIRSYLIVSP